jgi:hypothetical protein
LNRDTRISLLLSEYGFFLGMDDGVPRFRWTRRDGTFSGNDDRVGSAADAPDRDRQSGQLS